MRELILGCLMLVTAQVHAGESMRSPAAYSKAAERAVVAAEKSGALPSRKAISELVSQNKLKEAIAAMLAREEVTVKARSAPGATAKEKPK